MSNASSPSPPGDRLSDSPWLWLALFLAAALVALILIGPKYARRQEIIEHKYRAEQERGRRPAASGNEPAATAAPQTTGRPPAGSGRHEDLLIPLWPLVVLIAGLLALSLAALLRSRRKRTPGQTHREAVS